MEKFSFKKQVVAKKTEKMEQINKIEDIDPLEKKIEMEIFPILRVLNPNQSSFDYLYKDQVVEDLLVDVQKIEAAEGKLLPNPDDTVAKMKEILINRLKNVIQDDYKNDYKNKKNLDSDFIKKAKIVLLSLGDYSDLKKRYPNIEKDPIEAEDLVSYYLRVEKNDSDIKKLNGEEVKALLRGGLGSTLSNVRDYKYNDLIKETPDEYLQFLLKNGKENLMSRVLDNPPSREGYSRETIRLLIEKDQSYYVFKHIDFFKDSLQLEDVKSVIENYSPDYPYKLDNLINGVQKLDFKVEDKNEIMDFIFKNQNLSNNEYNDIADEKLQEKYKNIDENIQKLVRKNERWEDIIPEKMSKEELDILKGYIEDGYITFFHKRYKYLEYFALNNYEWLRDQVVKHDQENLLISGSMRLLKKEDQRLYAKKLVDKGDLNILRKLINKESFESGIFNNEDYKEISDKGLNIEKHIRLFSNLEEESFENFTKIYREGNTSSDLFLIKNISKFNFHSDKYEKEISYQKFVSYAQKCFHNNLNNFLPYFKGFYFSDYDSSKKEEHEKYTLELSTFLEKIYKKMFPISLNMVGISGEKTNWTKVGTAILDKDTNHNNFSKEECIGQEEYETLKKYGIDCDSTTKLSFFTGLNEETFNKIMLNIKSSSDFKSIISRFNLPEDSEYMKIYNELMSINDSNGNGNIHEFYFHNYLKEPEIKRKKIVQLIKDYQLVNNYEYYLTVKFVKRFEDYDLEGDSYLNIISKIKNSGEIGGLLSLHGELFERYLDVLENKDFSELSGICELVPEYTSCFKNLNEEEKKLFQKIFPWSESLVKMEGVQKQSNNKQHDPWKKSLVPLIKNLNENKIINLNDSMDGEIMLDFIKRFGMQNIPKLFELFSKVKKAGDLDSIDIETKNLLSNDFGINVEELLKNDKTNINLIINQIEKFQLDLFNKFLNEDSTILKKTLDSKYILDMIEIMKGNSGFSNGGSTESVIKKYLEINKTNPEKFKISFEYKEITVEIPEVVYEKDEINDLIKTEKEKILANPELNNSIDLYKSLIINILQEESCFQYLSNVRRVTDNNFKDKILDLKNKISEEDIKTERNEKMLIGLRGRLDKIERQCDDFQRRFTDDNMPIANILEIIQETIPDEFENKKEILLNLSARDIFNKLPEGFNQLTDGFDNLNKEDFAPRLSNFIGNHVREHYLNKKHGEEDAIESENKDLIKALKKHWGTTDFEKGIIPIMSNKLSELNNGQISGKSRSVTFVPSKGLMRIFSGDLGGACTSKQNMKLAEGDFENIISYSLVLDKENPKTERFVGSFLVIETQLENGEKAIVLRANNPAENLFNMVDGNSVINEILKEFKDLAQRRGIGNVLVPMAQGVCSNRSQVTSFYSKNFNNAEKVGLKNTNETNFNGYSLWNKESSHYVVKI